MMKRRIFYILFFASVLFSIPSSAQPPREGRQPDKRIEALKIEFIKQKLSLSDEETERFLPIYKNYELEIGRLFKERRQSRERRKEAGLPPEDELNFEGRILEVKKQYQKKFMEVLPAEKVSLLYQAEREFRERLINQLRQRRQESR